MLSARPGLRRVCLVRAAKGFGSKQEASEKSEKVYRIVQAATAAEHALTLYSFRIKAKRDFASL